MDEMSRWATEQQKEQALQSELALIEYQIVIAATVLVSVQVPHEHDIAQLRELVNKRNTVQRAMLDQMKVVNEVMREARVAFGDVRRDLEEMSDVH